MIQLILRFWSVKRHTFYFIRQTNNYPAGRVALILSRKVGKEEGKIEGDSACRVQTNPWHDELKISLCAYHVT